MDNLILIGDVHCKTEKYHDIVILAEQSNLETIQIGDFGFEDEHIWHLKNVDNKKHKILFGNHDFYPLVESNHSLGHYGYIEKHDLFYIRGAESIDRSIRTDGLDWFPEEQLNWDQSNDCLELYEQIKPGNLITHDCPFFLYPLFGITNNPKNHTSSLLYEVFNIHKPNQWFFGHHHQSFKIQYGGTHFQCLAELEYKIF